MRANDPVPGSEKLPPSPQERSVPARGHGEKLLDQVLAETQASQARPARSLQKPIGFRPEEISALVNSRVIDRYADDAPFLWQLRDYAVTAPHYSLRDLAKLDERLEAHLDGLRGAGEHGWGLAEKSLVWEGPGEVFTAGVLALEGRDSRRTDRVLEVACARRKLQRGLVSAAAWTEFATLRPVLHSWLSSGHAVVRRVGLLAFGVHRQDPGPALVHRLFDDDPEVRASALKVVAEVGRIDLLPMALHALAEKDPAGRFFAAWTSARLGDRSEPTLGVLREVAAAAGPFREQALTMALRCLPLAEAVAWLRELWKDPNHLRLAALGAGVVGDPELAGVTIEWMEIDDVARVAGEAFSMITGADLRYLDLDRDPPARDPQLDGDEFEVLDDDRDLPYPAVDKVARWWRSERDRFTPGRRYLCGSAIDPVGLRTVLLEGKQRQRAAAAIELALLKPAEPLFEVRSRGGLQEWRLRPWTS